MAKFSGRGWRSDLSDFIGLTVVCLLLLGGPSKAPAEVAPSNWRALEDEAVSVLSRYLQVDTSNPPGNEIQAARFFKAILEREGIEAQIIESTPGRGNIYARLKGDGSNKAVVLLNHLDVVPADRRFWNEDPFGGAVKDGYVWGRGALDMKGAAILELMTVLILERQKIPLARDVIFLGTADEEAGGRQGLGFLVRERFDLLRNAGLVLNEGGRIRLGNNGQVLYYGVGASEKSPLWLKLTVSGDPGHGSQPRPNSAVNKLISALERIIRYQTPLKVVPEVRKFYRDIADLEPLPRRQRLKNLEASLEDPIFAAEFTKDRRANARVRNTVAVTMLEGSSKVNVIPAQASAQLDIRLLPGEDPKVFLEELRKVIADPSIKIETVLSIPPVALPMEAEIFRVISEVARKYDPGAVVTTPLLSGFTDCHYFRETGIPCYGFIPIRVSGRDASLVHGSNERVSVENVRFGLRMLYEIVSRLVMR